MESSLVWNGHSHVGGKHSFTERCFQSQVQVNFISYPILTDKSAKWTEEPAESKVSLGGTKSEKDLENSESDGGKDRWANEADTDRAKHSVKL